MMEKLIYGLCAITAGACRLRLLLWSGLCFLGLTANNLLLVLERIVLADVDLATWRLGVAPRSGAAPTLRAHR